MTHFPNPAWNPAYILAIRAQKRVPASEEADDTMFPPGTEEAYPWGAPHITAGVLEDCFKRCLEKMGEPYCDACENLRMERILGQDNEEIVIPCSVCCNVFETPAKWSHPSNVHRYDLRNTQENE